MEKENIIRDNTRKHGVFQLVSLKQYTEGWGKPRWIDSISSVTTVITIITSKTILGNIVWQNKIKHIQTYNLVLIYTKNTMIVWTAPLTLISVLHHPKILILILKYIIVSYINKDCNKQSCFKYKKKIEQLKKI